MDNDLKKIDELFLAQDNYLKDVWLENERLYRAKYTNEQLKKLNRKRRSSLFIPTIRNTVNIIRAIFSTAFFGAGNPIELVPLSEDEKELYADRNKVIDYYFKKLKPNKELAKAFLSALIYRMGIVIVYWDRSSKKVVTTQVPVTDVAFDSECANIDDVELLAYKYKESNRVIKQKIKNGIYNQKGIKKELFDENSKDEKRRDIKVIYKKEGNKYLCKTYVERTLVRHVSLEYLPFCYGYALDDLASIDEDERDEQILCYGGDVVSLLSELQKEINEKRNLKNDMQQEILNPSVYVGDDADINVNDLTFGPGARIRVKGQLSSIKERKIVSEYALNTDLQFLAGDVQSAVGVNSIQEGKTSSSDRRSATALSVVNANSTMRIEEMIQTITDTLFEPWAKTWVRLVFKNADDEVINKITGKEYPFGKKGKRDDIEFDLEINFGMTLDKEKKIADLAALLQMVAQNPNINPIFIKGLLKEILTLRVGKSTKLDELFVEAEKRVAENPEDLAEIEAVVSGSI